MFTQKVVVASDSFKGSLSSLDICELFKKYPNVTSFPLADGGEGSLEALRYVLKGQYIDIKVKDLYFNKRKVRYFVSGNSAYIECASCVGLTLARKDNDPGVVTTYGLGEQMKDALSKGYKNIYIFLGGSASNDGGVGLAHALGVKFFNKENKLFLPVGLTLKDIKRIEPINLADDINITVLSDVKNPFCGPHGASLIFAKQKGASEIELPLLDAGLKHLAEIIKKDLHVDISNLPGSGAAGGLGGGLVAFTNAHIKSGIETLLDIINFDEHIKDSEYVISGEGKLDQQTIEGKVIDGIAKRCMKYHKPLLLIVGISEISLQEIQKVYPCVVGLYETNDKHLPFDEIKAQARLDYLKVIEGL